MAIMAIHFWEVTSVVVPVVAQTQLPRVIRTPAVALSFPAPKMSFVTANPDLRELVATCAPTITTEIPINQVAFARNAIVMATWTTIDSEIAMPGQESACNVCSIPQETVAIIVRTDIMAMQQDRIVDVSPLDRLIKRL